MRRNQCSVLYDLLEIIQNNPRTLDILYKSKMAFIQFQEYTDKLISSDFIRIELLRSRTRKKDVKAYYLTQKGMKFKEYLNDFNSSKR